MKSNLENIG